MQAARQMGRNTLHHPEVTRRLASIYRAAVWVSEDEKSPSKPTGHLPPLRRRMMDVFVYFQLQRSFGTEKIPHCHPHCSSRVWRFPSHTIYSLLHVSFEMMYRVSAMSLIDLGSSFPLRCLDHPQMRALQTEVTCPPMSYLHLVLTGSRG